MADRTVASTRHLFGFTVLGRVVLQMLNRCVVTVTSSRHVVLVRPRRQDINMSVGVRQFRVTISANVEVCVIPMMSCDQSFSGKEGKSFTSCFTNSRTLMGAPHSTGKLDKGCLYTLEKA